MMPMSSSFENVPPPNYHPLSGQNVECFFSIFLPKRYPHLSPICLSSRLLRRINCGQVDLCFQKHSDVSDPSQFKIHCLVELKEHSDKSQIAQFQRSYHRQKIRLQTTQDFLKALFPAPCPLIWLRAYRK
jgi:hypothetical protein